MKNNWRFLNLLFEKDCCKEKGINLIIVTRVKRTSSIGLKSERRKMDSLYVRLRSSAVFNTGEEARCFLPDKTENIQYFYFWGWEIDKLIWNYFLLIPLILDQSPLLTMKKLFSHYFRRSRYSPADDNPSSDRSGGEACFRQLPSAEDTHQCRQM